MPSRSQLRKFAKTQFKMEIRPKIVQIDKTPVKQTNQLKVPAFKRKE